MKSKLYVISGDFERKEFPLEEKVVLVGRGPDNHIRLNDRSVSRSHLKILRRGESIFIVDLGSHNGTWIDGKAVPPNTETPVSPGRHISLGNVLVTIGRVYEEEGLISRYMIDLADGDLDTELFRLLKDRRITDREHLEAVHEISTILMQSLDLRELLDQLAKYLFSALRSVDTMAILMVDSESGELHELASRSKFPEGDVRAEYSLTVARRTVEEMKAVIMADTELEEEENVSESMEFKKIKSVMCVPFIRKSRAMGAMYVHSVDKPFGFRKSELHLLTSLSGATAIAIENALLFKKHRTAEAALRKARDELEVRVDHRTRELSTANTLLSREIEERKRTEAALKDSEERLRDLFDNANDLIQSVSPEGRFLFVNQLWLDTLGYTPEDLPHLSLFDIIAPESLAHCEEAFRRVISGETIKPLQAVFLTRDGRRVTVEGSANCKFEQGRPVSTRAIFRDVTERMAAEEEREEVEERFRNLARAAQDAIISIDHEGLINYWNRSAEEMFGYPGQDAIGRDANLLLAPTRYRKQIAEGMEKWKRSGEGAMLGKTREFTARRRDGSEFPIELSLSSGKVKGRWNALAIVRDISDRKQSERDLSAAREREIEIASRIQETLLLGSPPTNIAGISIAAMTIPSQRIDGDFYEFITLPNRILDLILGDVMGKGVPAALLGAGSKRHFLKALNAMMSPSCAVPQPREIVQRVHSRMAEELIDLESFVTLTYSRFDFDLKRLDFVDCGHPRTLHLKATEKKIIMLEGSNVPLGVRLDEIYTQASVTFEEGDLFFFYSDGITEARDNEGRFFGRERLSRCILESASLSAEQVIAKVKNEVLEFSHTPAFSDDLTCVAVKIGGGPGTKPLSRIQLELESRLDELERLREFTRRACTAAGSEAADEDTVWQVWIALHEAVSNIIKHAYRGDAGGRIHIVAEAFYDEWVFSLCHRGKPFQGGGAFTPSPSPDKEHGFGLIIIENYMDEVRYSGSPDGTNTVRLVKKRCSSSKTPGGCRNA